MRTVKRDEGFFFCFSWRKFVKISGETNNFKKLKWLLFGGVGVGRIKIFIIIITFQTFALENWTIFPTIFDFFN
jgi:hypothetical protein